MFASFQRSGSCGSFPFPFPFPLFEEISLNAEDFRFSMGKVHIDMALSAATGPFHLSGANPNTPDSV